MKVSGTAYIFGLVCIVIHAWCAATVVVATRFMKDIHFTLVMFHYGLISSVILILCLVAEYFMYKSSFPNGFRLFTYDLNQWALLVIIAIINSTSMNFNTIACQYEKSSFITLIQYSLVVYAFIIDLALFGT